jgi:hypothetical protein
VGDKLLRELERRWGESGALEDEVALVCERVRAGQVSDAHLELAALLGSGAAARVLERGGLVADVQAFTARVEATQGEAYIRAALARARRSLTPYRDCADVVHEEALRLIRDCEEWLVVGAGTDPAEVLCSARALAARWYDPEPDWYTITHEGYDPPPPFHAGLLSVAAAILRDSSLRDSATQDWPSTDSIPEFGEVFAAGLQGNLEHGGLWALGVGEPWHELVPWLLGHADPLAYRVSRRRSEVARLRLSVELGELSPERLQLAAYLGHEAAGLASPGKERLHRDKARINVERSPFRYGTDNYFALLRERGGAEALLRALWLTWQHFAAVHAADPDFVEAERLLVEAILDPLAVSVEPLQSCAELARHRVEALPALFHPETDIPHPSRIPFLLTLDLVAVLSLWVQEHALPTWFGAGGIAERLGLELWVGRMRKVEEELGACRASFVPAVAEWALGYRDPVRDTRLGVGDRSTPRALG